MKKLHKPIYFAVLISCVNFSARAEGGDKKSNRRKQREVETKISEHGKQHIVKDNEILALPNKTNRELEGNYVYDFGKPAKKYTAMGKEFAEDLLNNKIGVREIKIDARGKTIKLEKPFIGYEVKGFDYPSNAQKKKAKEVLESYGGDVFVNPESARPKERYQLTQDQKKFSHVQPKLEKREFNQVRVVMGEDDKIKTIYPMSDTSDQE